MARRAQADPHFHLSQCQLLRDPEEAEAFRGRVPQLPDWIDAWAENSSTMSYRKQERVALNKRALSPGLGCVRKQRQKLVACIAEELRGRQRKGLAEATSICFAIVGKGASEGGALSLRYAGARRRAIPRIGSAAGGGWLDRPVSIHN